MLITILAPSYFFCARWAYLQSKNVCLQFSEGGRLQKELEYVEASLGSGAGATNQLLIQTPSAGYSSILTPDALLAHLEVLKTASKVMVEKNDATWTLKDLCYAPTIPTTEVPIIDQVSWTDAFRLSL